MAGISPASSGASATGLAAGSAYLPWLQAASPIVTAAMSPSPAGPSSSNGNNQYAPQTFDASNWSVATGQAKLDATANSAAGAAGGALGGIGPTSISWPWLAGLALLAIYLWKRH